MLLALAIQKQIIFFLAFWIGVSAEVERCAIEIIMGVRVGRKFHQSGSILFIIHQPFEKMPYGCPMDGL